MFEICKGPPAASNSMSIRLLLCWWKEVPSTFFEVFFISESHSVVFDADFLSLSFPLTVPFTFRTVVIAFALAITFDRFLLLPSQVVSVLELAVLTFFVASISAT